MAERVQPSEFELAQYQLVGARRLQWDNLLWQVPVLSLTAQAFLMTISLAPDSTAPARLASSGLSLVVTVLCVQLMHRHRAGELTDAAWLSRFEENFDSWSVAHGPKFAALREARIAEGIHERMPFEGLRKRITNWRPFTVWVIGLLLFGLTALGVFVSTLVLLLI